MFLELSHHIQLPVSENTFSGGIFQVSAADQTQCNVATVYLAQSEIQFSEMSAHMSRHSVEQKIL